MEVLHLLVAARHAYEGRPADGPSAPPPQDLDRVEVVAGKGLRGDRYFARPAHARASVTLLAVEDLEAVARDLGLAEPPDPALLRRNVVLRGADVDALRGHDVELDCGEGPVLLRCGRPANPCAWMDVVLAPGAFRALRGRGGVRAAPLTSGALRRGPARLRVLGVSPAGAPGTHPR
ncbi:molybdenum cofactor biosysynthesis protein [Vallicoccus soli]|uniref:Molybdenum cofactor biosysynthesis protein n=1 Tax=Vallicoccus soli TaxID=2339232 RepID=A0A3A3YUT5_9ACTN|nr:molybdenum cofactor biosysynthesis protein [Vallicoccus soli]